MSNHFINQPPPRVVTRAILFGTNMHQIGQWLGFRPQIHGEAHSAPTDPVAGKEGGEKEGKKRGREGREEEGWGREGRGGCLLLNLRLATPVLTIRTSSGCSKRKKFDPNSVNSSVTPPPTHTHTLSSLLLLSLSLLFGFAHTNEFRHLYL